MQQPGGVSDLASSFRFPEPGSSSLMTLGRMIDRTLRFGHDEPRFMSTIQTDITITNTLRRHTS
jgi:hypothetical protein